ncbi:MAG: glycosyltransferase [Chthoniobacterales bacterium]
MPASSSPVVACYCATFLKPEMLHIYRQIMALERFRPVVIAQKREEAERFPFDPVFLVGKPWTHFLRRFWFRTWRKAPWQISHREVLLIKRVLFENEAQLLHIYFGHIAVHLLPLILHWKQPTVVSFHGADVLVELDNPHYRAATREMLAVARLVLVRSESLGRALRELGCAPGKIRLHRTGIPLADIPFRIRTWPDDGAWRFLQAGRLIEKKGLKTSLRAFAAFRAKHQNATFTIAGEGPLQRELQALARELGIADGVRFAGFLSQAQLREQFNEAHIFLHPSELGADGNQEGVPNAMLEAMASGLPVFATRHGGIAEAITEGESGVLVGERDHPALAARLLDWVNRPDELAPLARRGAAAVAEKFEQKTQARVLEDYYSEALRL